MKKKFLITFFAIALTVSLSALSIISCSPLAAAEARMAEETIEEKIIMEEDMNEEEPNIKDTRDENGIEENEDMKEEEMKKGEPLIVIPDYKNSRYKEIYLAGGCFWGIQAYFDGIIGIEYTSVGYANGESEKNRLLFY